MKSKLNLRNKYSFNLILIDVLLSIRDYKSKIFNYQMLMRWSFYQLVPEKVLERLKSS